MTNLIVATYLVVCTAYCNEGPNGCSKCCGKWAKHHRTASGTVPHEGYTIACNWLPFGTQVRIEGVGCRVVEDRMSKRFGNRIDLYFQRHSDALKFGKQTLKIEVFSRPEANRSRVSPNEGLVGLTPRKPSKPSL